MHITLTTFTCKTAAGCLARDRRCAFVRLYVGAAGQLRRVGDFTMRYAPFPNLSAAPYLSSRPAETTAGNGGGAGGTIGPAMLGGFLAAEAVAENEQGSEDA